LLFSSSSASLELILLQRLTSYLLKLHVLEYVGQMDVGQTGKVFLSAVCAERTVHKEGGVSFLRVSESEQQRRDES